MIIIMIHKTEGLAQASIGADYFSAEDVEKYCAHLINKGENARRISEKLANKYNLDANILEDMVEVVMHHKDDEEQLKRIMLLGE